MLRIRLCVMQGYHSGGYIFPDIIIWPNVLLNVPCMATIAINIGCRGGGRDGTLRCRQHKAALRETLFYPSACSVATFPARTVTDATRWPAVFHNVDKVTFYIRIRPLRRLISDPDPLSRISTCNDARRAAGNI